jgi:hypothetical protein
MVVGDRQKHLACLLTVKAVMDPATLEVTIYLLQKATLDYGK